MKYRVNMPSAFALSALALALPALAQSSVKVSGTIDIGVYRDTHAQTTNVGPISRSYLTFSGSEDLGNGTSAQIGRAHV